MQEYILIAGVNGSGKSTFYSSTFASYPLINSDVILAELGLDWKSRTNQFYAMEEALHRIYHNFENGVSFYQETTLAGNGCFRLIEKAHEKHFFIKMCYIGVDNPQIAIARVKKRVLNGGHGVDEDTIMRRYTASLRNLLKIIPLCDEVIIYDNSLKCEKRVFLKGGNLIYYDEGVKWIDEMMPRINAILSTV